MFMNIGNKPEPKLVLTSLLMALLMWVSISGRRSPEEADQERFVQQIPLRMLNCPPTMKLKSDNYQIRVTLGGPENELRTLREEDILVSLDLQGLEPKGLKPIPYRLPLTAENVALPNYVTKVQTKDIFPNLVEFTLVPWTSKTVKLFVATKGKPLKDFDLIEILIDPPTVNIEGPTEFVAPLSVLMAKPIDIEGADRNITQKLDFDFVNDIPRDTVIREGLNDLYFTAVIREKTRVRNIRQTFTLHMENNAFTTSIQKVKLTIEGPISVMRWFKNKWVEPEILIPEVINDEPMVDGNPDSPQPEVENGSESGTEPAAVQMIPITNRWVLPEEVKEETPDWLSRVARLTLKWEPEKVEVRKK